MNVLTLNLHNYMENDRLGKLIVIAKQIKEDNIDVVMLQEVGQFCYGDFKFDNIRYTNLGLVLQQILKDKYNLDYFLNVTMFKISWETYEEGIAVLTKKETTVNSKFISKKQEYSNWDARMIQYFKYDDVLFVNGHYGWDQEDETFADQFEAVLKVANSDKVLLAGDFNHTPNSIGYKLVVNKYQDLILNYNKKANSEYSFIPDKTRIDYIFGKNVKINNYKYVFINNNVSDHLGIVANIEGVK